MRPLINHFYNSQKIKRLLKNCNSNDLSKNLFWYDLSIGYASSISGFFKVFFLETKTKLFAIFHYVFFKKKKYVQCRLPTAKS